MIRKSTLSDIADIERLEAELFASDRLSRRALLYHLKNPNAVMLSAGEEGNVQGYGLIFRHKRARAARLYSLAVGQVFQGKGVAGALLTALEQAAQKPVLRLEVREDNVAARALYERRNYRITGVRDEFYADGAPAVLMEKDLN